MKKSTNKFTTKVFKKNTKAWSGDNQTGSAYGAEEKGNEPYGIGEYGGVRHFRKTQ